MYPSITNNSFSYLVSLDEFRNEIPEDIRPSWVKLTTITMISSFKKDINIQKIRQMFEKVTPIAIRKVGSKMTEGREWVLKPTTFYNQITLSYTDQYSTKSIKIFPNGSIQVAGCTHLPNCKHIIKQLSVLFRICLGDEYVVPHDTFRVVMINSNFSLNWNINLMRTANHFENYSDVFKVSFEPDRYSAVKVKFKPAEDMKEVTASIFSTGKIIITGAETFKEIAFAYNVINQHINTDPSIRVSRVDPSKMEVFDRDTLSGQNITDFINKLKTMNIKSWKRTITNRQINF
jgi:TATA-box binding protein (TBP) (component of TFIID and TFIIIB)